MTIDRIDLHALSKEFSNRGTLLHFKANGSSMHPFIQSGNTIVIKPLEKITVNIGDIIFFRRTEKENSFTAHRLIKIGKGQGGTQLFTKGDDLGYYDPPVLQEQVIGRVVRVERNGKRLELTSRPWCIFGYIIACFARGRYYNQRRVVRNLGRLWWMMGRRRIK